ncbi:hypothetical protein ACH5RR_029596 [Cinchona calisaya]|uniref:Uncharacterized protein n=1 Tax=Cinchona calisaya TaxID=153742 RepID=A0ABD2YVN1_9GENT
MCRLEMGIRMVATRGWGDGFRSGMVNLGVDRSQGKGKGSGIGDGRFGKEWKVGIWRPRERRDKESVGDGGRSSRMVVEKLDLVVGRERDGRGIGVGEKNGVVGGTAEFLRLWER